MKILVNTISETKKQVSVIDANGKTISYRTMERNADGKMLRAINYFEKKYSLKDKDIQYGK